MGWGDKIVVAFLSVPSKGVTDRRKHPHWVPPVNPTLQQDATPSAKTGNNVQEAFDVLSRRIYDGLLSGEVELREGWDGVKCTTPQGLNVQREGAAGQPQTADGTKRKKKCCG